MRSRQGFGAFQILALVALVALAGGAAWYLRFRTIRPLVTGPMRLAVLPFENQTGKAEYDWLGRGLSIAVAERLVSAPDVSVLQVASVQEASGRADVLLQGYLTRDAKGISFRYWAENLGSHKAQQEGHISPMGERDVAVASESLARLFSSRPGPMPTANLEALQAFAEASEESEPEQGRVLLEKAIALDSSFSLAWARLAATLAATGKREEALAVIDRSRREGAAMAAPVRARLDLLQAQIQGDAQAQRDALIRLAMLSKEDANLQAGAAEASLQTRNFGQAITFYENAVRLQPANADYRNLLGYAQTYAGRTAEAARTMEEYRKLAPTSANPHDSLGESFYYHGRMEEASKEFLEGFRKEPDFLRGLTQRKAAEARLLAGDIEGATAEFRKYLESRQKSSDPMLSLMSAQWAYRLGRRAEAMTQVAGLMASDQTVVSRMAALQLGFWHLDAGEFARAAELSAQLRGRPLSPSVAVSVALLIFASQPDGGAEEWVTRAGRQFPNPANQRLRTRILGLTLLWHGYFKAAVPVWKAAFDQSPPNDDSLERDMLAWALQETGSKKEAEPLVSVWGIPNAEEIDFLGSILAPRAVYLRAVAHESAGRSAEARRLFEIYARISPAVGDRFGHAEKARSAATL